MIGSGMRRTMDWLIRAARRESGDNVGDGRSVIAGVNHLSWGPGMCRKAESRESGLTFSRAGLTLGSGIGGVVGIIVGTIAWAEVWVLLCCTGAHRGLPTIYNWFVVIPACIVGTIGALMSSYPGLWTDDVVLQGGEKQ